MTFNFKGIEYTIVYLVDDLYEHMYNITLMDDKGEEFDVENENPLGLSNNDRMHLYRMVDQDAWGNAVDAAEYACGG